MNKPIRTYQDLIHEKQQVELLLKAQHELVRQDMLELKSEFQPLIRTARTVGKAFTREKANSLLSSGAETAIDLLFKKVILGRASWLTRLIVPFFVKNISSHVIAQKKGAILHKVAAWLKPKHHNGKSVPNPDPSHPTEDKTKDSI
jgi:hypothetical protein